MINIIAKDRPTTNVSDIKETDDNEHSLSVRRIDFLGIQPKLFTIAEDLKSGQILPDLAKRTQNLELTLETAWMTETRLEQVQFQTNFWVQKHK